MAKKSSSSSRTLKVYCDSGANIHSCNKETLTIEDLGFESWDEWDELPEGEKHKIVEEFWNSRGYPEIGWED